MRCKDCCYSFEYEFDNKMGKCAMCYMDFLLDKIKSMRRRVLKKGDHQMVMMENKRLVKQYEKLRDEISESSGDDRSSDEDFVPSAEP